ncbi:hypothetical protein UFOVP518_3 [uncultured Caudovirales phage]|uniref:Uncharacterized protein n=1 Tax=uncultured Caudovirales phage TaxID=2100421 RepID=A0A6J5MN73_9CAUD|nr:hypothetical protein UFOVP518_3 [uncultured Caudovirales phage]
MNPSLLHTTEYSAKIKTWINQIDTGNIKSNTARVLRYIKNNQFTDITSIRKHISHQTATSILSELMDSGIVKVVGDRNVNDSFYSVLKYVDDPAEQVQVSHARKMNKYKAWVERGMNDFDGIIDPELKKLLLKINY